MKYRELGRTGLRVSEIGFGTWGIGGDAYGPAEDSVSRAALHRALELGINFYDTADLYGAGHSEEVLGSAFQNQRDKVIIATKGGTLPHDTFFMPQDFSPRHLRKALAESLRRLKTDYIDLYQLHSPQLDLPNWPEIVDTMQALVQEGSIRAFGVSARSPGDAKILLEKYAVPAVQVNFNMIDQRCYDSGLIDFARENSRGIIARTPLCFGYLTGKLSGEEDFKGKDHRAKWPREQLKAWAKAPQLFAPLNVGKSRTLPQLALQYCISDSAVATVIPGMMSPGEVEENVAISNLPEVTSEECDSIRKIYKSNLFFDPHAKTDK